MSLAFSTFILPPPVSESIQILVLSLLVSGLVYKLVRKLTTDELTPPRPWGFPIVGHLPLLGKEPNVTFMKMREKYGDIFQIQMGSWSTVVVNGKEAIREALNNSEDDFSGRPQFKSSKIINNGESLSLGQFNEKWKAYHKKAAKVINEFSNVKKNRIQEMIHEEVNALVNAFASYSGKCFDPQKYIYLSISSIIYQICYGQEHNIRENKDFITYQLTTSEFNEFVRPGNPIDTIPWLQYVMPWKLKEFARFVKICKAFRRKRVEEHKDNFSPDHLQDITDRLLAASKQQTNLTEERIMDSIDAFFGAGTETLTSLFRWALFLMAAHPDVQKRVQDEIDEIVGDGRRPEIKDRGSLMYTEAVLHEINRYVALEPLALPHSTTRDTRLGGYCIKKDTVVLINLFSMSHDKAVWGDPDVFRPGRFLNMSGQIEKSLLKEFLPFSSGRRKCMGESLAKTEMFLFLSGLLQRCSILKPPEIKEYNMDVRVGLTRECPPYNVRVHLRN